MTDLTYPPLAYVITGDRIEYYFRGILICSGLASNDHSLWCIKEMRRIMGGGEFGDGSYQAARRSYNERQPLVEDM